ncbi:MAG: hypothetical protein QXU97_04170 [Fervidicoccaceae archaeon]
MRRGGSARLTRPPRPPESLDAYAVDYAMLFGRALTSGDPMSSAPFARFLEDPIGVVLVYKGCVFDCVTCGCSRSAYSKYLGGSSLARKLPRVLWGEVRSATEYFKIPVFALGDLQLLGGLARGAREGEQRGARRRLRVPRIL